MISSLLVNMHITIKMFLFDKSLIDHQNIISQRINI